MRRARIHRKTNETEIRIALTDGRPWTGHYRTGIRFLDHMLELVARHGAFDLKLKRPAISTLTSTTRWRTSASRWARLSRKRWAASAAFCAPDIL